MKVVETLVYTFAFCAGSVFFDAITGKDDITTSIILTIGFLCGYALRTIQGK